MGRVVESLRALTRARPGAGRAPQVVLTTHSPALLHHVRPDEVRLVCRDAHGHTRVEKPGKGTSTGDLARRWLGGSFEPV